MFELVTLIKFAWNKYKLLKYQKIYFLKKKIIMSEIKQEEIFYVMMNQNLVTIKT